MRFTTFSHVLAALALTTGAAAQAPKLVRDFYPGNTGIFNNSGHPYAFRIHDNKLLLFATDAPGQTKLFALNDLSGNVQELANVGGAIGYSTTNGGIITSGDNIYFYGLDLTNANGILWCVHNGTAEMLANIPYVVFFYYAGIPLPDGRLIFIQSDPDHGFEPWITDGTAAGTHLLKDINPGTATSIGEPFPLFQGFDFQGRAYFQANDGTNGMQLWSTDGTEAGTQQFAVINEVSASGAITLRWAKNDDHFIVTAPDGLLTSDGTTAGTTNMHPGPFAWAHISGLTYPVSPEGWMYFSSVDDGAWKLYRTKGTEATTEMVLGSGLPNQGFPYLAEMGGMLYVFNVDNDANVILVRIDPVAHTATTIKTFQPPPGGSGTSDFYGFRADSQHIYFMGREGSHARQYWQSDGTTAGTQMVYEFMPNAQNGGPDAADGNMIVFNNTFVFTANDPVVGAELFAGSGVSGIAESANANGSVKAWCDGDRELTVRALDGELIAVQLMDAAGRTVERTGGLHTDLTTLSTRGQAAGIYLLHVTTTKGEAVVRVALP